MATREQVLADIARLAQSGNVPAFDPSSLPPTASFVAPVKRQLDLPDFNYTGLDFAGPASSGGGEGDLPLWQRALLQLDRPRAAVANVLDEVTDGKRSSLGSLFNRGWAGISNKEHTGMEKILGNLGWTEMKEDVKNQSFGDFLKARLNNSSRNLASFLGDVGIDPTTYVTFGAGSAIKAGALAGSKTAAEVAAKAGVKAGKDLHAVPYDIFDKIKTDLVNKGINPDLAERFATGKMNEAAEAIGNAGKAARNKAQNALINLDIPFTNITKQFGRKPGFLQKTEQKIGQAGALGAAEAARVLGKTEDDIKSIYGVKSLDDLNIQQLEHLQSEADRFAGMQSAGAARKFANDGSLKNNLRDFKTVDEVIGKEQHVDYKPFSPDEWLNELTTVLGHGKFTDRIAPFVRSFDGNVDQFRKIGPEGIQTFGSALGKLPGTIKGKTAKGIEANSDIAASLARMADNTATVRDVPIVGQVAKEVKKTVDPATFTKDFKSSKFVQDMGGRSKVGNALGKVGDHFNARTLGSKEGVVNQAASKLRDTENRLYAEKQQVKRDMAALQKQSEGLTPEQIKAIPYIIEGKFPDKGFKRSDVTDQMKNIANQMSAILKRTGDAEMEAGSLQALRKGYFPHVIDYTPEQMASFRERFKDDKSFSQLLGRASADNFSKERKSFETLAELDNAMASLQKAREKPDLTPEQISEIDEKLDVLKNLFDRDPFTALAKRYSKSVKTTAMKKLYNQFSKDGIVLSPEKARTNPDVLRNKDYVELDQAQAKALGLEQGTYMHKDVLDALKRVDKVFTNDGFNKLLSNVESVQNIWKTIVTSVPSHYWNNLVGNVFNNTLAGVKPGSYERAGSILKRAKNGTLTKMQQKIFDEALKNGVLHQNFLSDFVRADELVPESKLGAFEKKFRDNKVTKAMREKAGQPVENLTRFALFIHGIEKTGSIKQASALVRKHLFNYNELTSADRVARVMVPFWNWMKNNIPLQIEKLAQNPRFYKQYLHLKEQSQEDTEGDIPQWAREASFGLGGNKMYNPSLPVNDLNGIFGNSPVDPLRTLLSSMNEIAKVPTEIVTNKSLFTGKPIDYEREYRGGFDPAAWAKYGLGQFGKVGKTAYDAADGEGNILEAILNLINPVGSPVTLK